MRHVIFIVRTRVCVEPVSASHSLHTDAKLNKTFVHDTRIVLLTSYSSTGATSTSNFSYISVRGRFALYSVQNRYSLTVAGYDVRTNGSEGVGHTPLSLS